MDVHDSLHPPRCALGIMIRMLETRTFFGVLLDAATSSDFVDFLRAGQCLAANPADLDTHAAGTLADRTENWDSLVGSGCCRRSVDRPCHLAGRIDPGWDHRQSGIRSVATRADHHSAGSLGLDLDAHPVVPPLPAAPVLELGLAPLALGLLPAYARSLPPSCELSTPCGFP